MAHRRRSILPVTRTSNKIVVPAAASPVTMITPPVTIATPSTETTTAPPPATNAAVSETTTAAASTTPDTSTTTTARAPRTARRPDPKHSMRRRSAVPLLLRLGLSMTAAASQSITGPSGAGGEEGTTPPLGSQEECGGERDYAEKERADGVEAQDDAEALQGACDLDVQSVESRADAAKIMPRLEIARDDAKPIDEDDAAKLADCDDAKPADCNETQIDANYDAKPSWTSALVTDDEAARWTRLIIGAACDEVRTAVESGDSEDVKGVIERGATGGPRKRRCPWQPFALPRPSSAPCA